MPADWCPACGPHFVGRCPHIPYPLDGPLLGDPLPLTEEQILRLRAILAAEDDKPVDAPLTDAEIDAARTSLRDLAGFGAACPANHPAACVASTPEGTASCRWCDEVAAIQAAAHTHHVALVDDNEKAAHLLRGARSAVATLAVTLGSNEYPEGKALLAGIDLWLAARGAE